MKLYVVIAGLIWSTRADLDTWLGMSTAMLVHAWGGICATVRGLALSVTRMGLRACGEDVLLILMKGLVRTRMCAAGASIGVYVSMLFNVGLCMCLCCLMCGYVRWL